MDMNDTPVEADSEANCGSAVAVCRPESVFENSNETQEEFVTQCDAHDDPFSESYVSTVTMAPTERDKVYTWLTSGRTVSVARLRAYCKGLGLRQSGKKRALICFLLLSASQLVETGTAEWKSLFAPEYAAWTADPVTISTQIFHIAPTDAEIKTFRPEASLPRCTLSNGTGDEREPSVSLNEFARLCAILYRDANVRSSLIRSGLNLTRAQLDRGETRDEFWETEVSPRFNDSDLRPELELRGVLSGVDSALPAGIHRSGEKLKGVLFRSKKIFSTAYRRWKLSGQMDSECESFKDFLPRVGRSSVELTPEGKRAAVLFQALRCGTLLEDAESLRFTIKVAPDGIGYDEIDDDAVSSEPPTAKRLNLAKQMTASDISEAARTLAEPFDRLAASIMARKSEGSDVSQARAARSAGNTDSERGAAVSRNIQNVRDRREIVDAMMSVKKAFDAVKDEDDMQSISIREVLEEELKNLQSLLKYESQ